jgi:ribonuclease Z
MTKVINNKELQIFSSPVNHLVPNIGLRIESLQTGKVAAYSCDTEPCSQVEELAKDADVLLHETSGAGDGHSSASQAAKVAENAGAKSLYFVHYPTHLYQSQDLILAARKNYSGKVKFARDLLELIL